MITSFNPNNPNYLVLAGGGPKKNLSRHVVDPFNRILNLIQALFCVVIVLLRIAPKEKKLSPSNIKLIKDTEEIVLRNKQKKNKIQVAFKEIQKHPSLVDKLNVLWHQSESKMLPPQEGFQYEKQEDPIIDAWSRAKLEGLSLNNQIKRYKQFCELNPSIEGILRAYNINFSINDF